VPVLLNAQVQIGEIHVGLSQTFIEKTIQDAIQQIGYLALIFIFIGIFVTVIMVSLIVRPIRAWKKARRSLARATSTIHQRQKQG